MKQIIESIINNFAQQGFVFSNEQDFQFELALALRNSKQVKEVKLEALSLPCSWQMIQTNVNLKRDDKEYTDIIVRKNTGEYIAIELKFKTADKICYYQTTKSGNVATMKQGAHNINAYDFINDIVRLENINGRYFYNGFKVSKGYAILLTNNQNYRYNNFSGSSIWKNYSIDDGKCLSGTLLFNGNQQRYITGNRTFDALTLGGLYTLDWKDYPLPNYQDYQDIQKSCHPGFSYLIVEVKP